MSSLLAFVVMARSVLRGAEGWGSVGEVFKLVVYRPESAFSWRSIVACIEATYGNPARSHNRDHPSSANQLFTYPD